MTTPECPKGPEREARPEESLREKLAQIIAFQWGHDEKAFGSTNADRLATAVAVCVVEPELERLTAEVNQREAQNRWLAKALERIAYADESDATQEIDRLNDERDALSGLLRGMARRVGEFRQSLKFADAHVPQWERIIVEHKAEVSRLREQLAAQQPVWAPAEPTDESARLAEALRFVGVVDPDDDCMSVFDTRGEGIKHWVPVESITLRLLEHMAGVSSCEVEAPQPQEMAQHRVAVQMADSETLWRAVCSVCGPSESSSHAAVQSMADQHEADTLRPQLQANSKLEQNFVLDELSRQSQEFEGRPSGSTAAPRSDEEWCDQCQDHVSGSHYHCAKCGQRSGMLGHSLRPCPTKSPEDAAQAARSGATQEFWRVGDRVHRPAWNWIGTVRQAEPQLDRYSVQWDHLLDRPRSQGSSWVNAAELTEVPSPSLRKEGEDTPSLTDRVLADVAAERERQESKWGQQNHADRMPADYPIGDRPNADLAAAHWKRTNDERVAWMSEHGMPKDRNAAWDGILLEEVYEALAESDSPLLRAELVQVAAVAVAWIEAIDRRVGAAVSSQEEKKEGETDGH